MDDLQTRISELHAGLQYRPVGVFALHNAENELLLYQSSKNLNYWGFIQGGIDLDESPLDAFYREIGEEIGVRRKDLGSIKTANNIQLLNSVNGGRCRDGFSKGKAYLLMLAEYTGSNKFVLQKEEVEAVEWVDFKEADKRFRELRARKSGLLLNYLDVIEKVLG